MKLAFSTLGCPEWTLEQVIAAGQRFGYAGIEFRGLLAHLDLVEVPEFAPAQIAATRRRLEDAGLGVSCLASSVSVVAATTSDIDRHTAVEHARRYIELAKELRAPCIRLFCGNVPATLDHGTAMDYAADTLRKIGDFAAEHGVIAAVETHDDFTRSELLMELIRLTRHPAVQVLWDIHHPYRLSGETIEHTMHYLDGHIADTHVKDSVLNADGEGYTYVPLGQGDVPLLEALRALKKAGYDGYLTLEWEKRWIPALQPPEIVFPQYAEQMREWLAII